MFVSGNRDGVLIAVQPVSIHGTVMLDVTVQLTSESSARTARVGPESITGTLVAGAPVVVTFLMNVITAIRVV